MRAHITHRDDLIRWEVGGFAELLVDRHILEDIRARGLETYFREKMIEANEHFQALPECERTPIITTSEFSSNPYGDAGLDAEVVLLEVLPDGNIRATAKWRDPEEELGY